MAAGVNTLSKTFVWILMGLLIAGLAGFGVLNMSGTVRTIGNVGNQEISVDEYVRELQGQIRAIEAQTGQPLPVQQAFALGLDQSALSRLVALASLDSEVADLGLSIGDANLHQEIVGIQAFQGANGEFDREAYRFQLERANLREADFEADLRAEAARTLVQGAIISGVIMPETLGDTLTSYVAARRSFTYARLDGNSLTQPLQEATDADLRAFYEEYGDDFTLPETKRLSYVLLSPSMLLDQVDVDEAALQRLYDERAYRYNIPERRLVERLVFGDEAGASDAMAQLEVSGTTFELLVNARGLSLADVDMGDLARDDLGAAADAVFGADIGQVVGPLASGLGPALYRVNGALTAQETSFADARAELHEELAGERARRLIDAQAEDISDLLAGGATLEDLANETDMQLSEIEWTEFSSDGIAAYEAFRASAAAVSEGDFPEVAFLQDGGMFALQLNQVLPTRPEPFEDAKPRVTAAWLAAQTQTALRAQANDMIAELALDGDFTTTGLEAVTETGLIRTAFLEGTPPDFMTQVFEMDKGDLQVIVGGEAVYVVHLEDVLPPEETAEFAALRARLAEEMNQTLAQALFDAFVRDAQTRVRPSVDQSAVNAVNANFSGGGGGGSAGGNPAHGQPGHVH